MKKNTQKNSVTTKSIVVENLSKTFLVPHQKIDTVRGAFVNLFSKNTYEEFNALDDVSFEVEKGEFVGILGHNGSGKSTLLKCLAKVYTPDSGNIKIHGEISPFLELGIGFNQELSGRDNIYLNATILGLSQQEIEDRFEEIVAFSEVGDFIDQQVKNYSSGMKGRLAFSVAIHANRDILLMDEVLAVGDARFQEKCMNQFEEYKKQKKTVVLVTHNIGAVRDYCDRAILIDHGKIEMIGDPAEVVERYIELNLDADQKAAFEKKEREHKKEKLKKEMLLHTRMTAEVKKVTNARKKEEALAEQKATKEVILMQRKEELRKQKEGTRRIIIRYEKRNTRNMYDVGDRYEADLTIIPQDEVKIDNDIFLDCNLYKEKSLLISVNRLNIKSIDTNVKVNFEIPKNLGGGMYYIVTNLSRFDQHNREVERFEYMEHPPFKIVNNANGSGPILFENFLKVDCLIR